MKTEIKLSAIKYAKGILNFLNAILSKIHFSFVVQMRHTNWKRPSFVSGYDYIRFSSLDLVAHEIYVRKIFGAVAELGVYRGDFASRINAAFPDRKFYLFDTFEGFDKRNVSTEKENAFSGALEKDFRDTSINLVLKKMPYKENCIVKKGFFPKTATGIDEKFCFVSIDCDLYDPILNGLNYFWKNLTGGGIYLYMTTTIAYIMVRTPPLIDSFWKIPMRKFSHLPTRLAHVC